MPFADHFSRTAANYAVYRPAYPRALFAWLAERVPGRGRAWDCGTGSGQAAVPLADHFELVVASDPSASQVANAVRAPRVLYAVMTAEASALSEGSVDLITVAQALHWFDRPRFYAEARRVLVSGGLLAVWRYGLLRVGPDIDPLIERFHSGTVGPYWPAERALVDAGYHTVDFLPDELEVPPFDMTARWSLDHLAGYLATWSAVSRYRSATGADPLPAFVDRLAAAWGDPASAREIRWPIEVRVARL